MSTSYQMWLTCNAEAEKVRLPVLPEKLSVGSGSLNDSMDIATLGEVTIMQGRPALEISFSSFFPATRFPGIQEWPTESPLALVQRISGWKGGDKPVHLIATACGIDLYCTIEKFEYEEVGGDPGTYHYDISLKEYREITTRQVTVSVPKQTSAAPQRVATVQPKTQPRVDNTVQPKTYTVKAGDCLWDIAKQLYGSGSDYTKLYDANKGVVGSNPNLIYPGQVLTIP